jgi:hypothetical protein
VAVQNIHKPTLGKLSMVQQMLDVRRFINV